MNRSERSWERRLLAMAYEGLENEPLPEPFEVDPQTLDEAYTYCDAVAREHSRTFYMASSLLPPSRRRSVRALYAFCRITDDLIDRAVTRPVLNATTDGDLPRDGFSRPAPSRATEVATTKEIVFGADGDLAEQLARWQACALASPPPCDDPVALAWADTRARHRIPARYALQLVDGVMADLNRKRYASFDELAVYCYGVASTVGLMSMHIIGFSGRDAIPYAVKLGVAMQVTNILRDVREDWEAGRLYLPQDELAVFGLTEDDIAAGRADDRWRAFMRFQIERNRQLYTEAMPGIAKLDPGGRFAIGAAAELYRAILEDIEVHNGDVFTRRAHIGTWGKLRRLPGIWLRVRNMRDTAEHTPVEEWPQPAEIAQVGF